MATAVKKKATTAKAAEPVVEIVAFKGTDKNGQCRGFQYEVGKTYEHKGRVEACESGFHSCENPLDVWAYYGLGEDNRFFRVRAAGKIARHDSDSKVASGSITIEAELKLPDFIKAAVKWVVDATKGKGDDPSGHYAQIGSSGDYARIGSSGHYARIGSSGDSARIGSSGDSARIGSSGHYARIGSSGDYAQIGSSGDSARIDASGSSATIAVAGREARAKAGADGAICLAYCDGKRPRFAIGYVGEDGIEADTWYQVVAGKLAKVR